MKSYEFKLAPKTFRVHACIRCGQFPIPQPGKSTVTLACHKCGRHVTAYSQKTVYDEWNRINPIPADESPER